MLDLVKEILRLVGREDLEPDVRGETSPEIRHQYLDAAKARRTLQWRPQFSLRDGLTRTIEWYRELLNKADATSARHSLGLKTGSPTERRDWETSS